MGVYMDVLCTESFLNDTYFYIFILFLYFELCDMKFPSDHIHLSGGLRKTKNILLYFIFLLMAHNRFLQELFCTKYFLTVKHKKTREERWGKQPTDIESPREISYNLIAAVKFYV